MSNKEGKKTDETTISCHNNIGENSNKTLTEQQLLFGKALMVVRLLLFMKNHPDSFPEKKGHILMDTTFGEGKVISKAGMLELFSKYKPDGMPPLTGQEFDDIILWEASLIGKITTPCKTEYFHIFYA